MYNSIIDSRFLAIGTILTGRYEIQGVIGAGGFGITYKAYDNFMDCTVAIKEYYPAGIVNRVPGQNTISICAEGYVNEFNKGKKRFLSEAKDLYKFKDSPNIVSVQNFFEENMTAYMAMEYLDGCTLGQYVKRLGGRLDVDSTLYVMNKLMEALSELHQAGIIHRDISPDNIFITNELAVKLIDFGAAKQAYCGETQNLSIMLKPGYAPAEQYSNNSHQSAWTDIYAVGATMYKVLTGVKPVESISRVLNDDLAQPITLNPQIPQYLNNAIVKAMSVRPEDRFQSIVEFKNAIFATSANIIADDNKTVLMNVLATEQGTILINNDSYTNNSAGTEPVAQPQFNYVQPAVNIQTGSNYTNGGNNGDNKPKKKKNGLIVALVCFTICLIAGGTFAVVKLNNKDDKNTTEKNGQLAASEDEKNTGDNTTQSTTEFAGGTIDCGLTLPNPNSGETLYIYTSTDGNDEITDIMDLFLQKYPEYEDNYEVVVMNGDDSELADNVAVQVSETGNRGLVWCELDYASYFMYDSDYCSIDNLNITDDMYGDACKYTKYVLTNNSKIYGMAPYVCPGVVYYRTDIAQSVFGTSASSDISDMLVTWENYMNTCETLKNAGYYMNSSLEEYNFGSMSGDDQSYYIESMISGGYTRDTVAWDLDWYDDMNRNVFSYYGSNWFWTIMCENTVYRWEICDSPNIFAWGGRAFYIDSVSASVEQTNYLAALFLYTVCCDEDYLLQYARKTHMCPNNYSVVVDLDENYYTPDPNLNNQDPYDVYSRAFYWLDQYYE